MADQKISELNELTDPAGNDELAIVDKDAGPAETKRITVDNLLAGAGFGDGDLIGPDDSTDNAIVRFDGSTGKLVQNSAVTIDDLGNVMAFTDAGGATIRVPDGIGGAPGPDITILAGDGGPAVGEGAIPGGSVVLTPGQGGGGGGAEGAVIVAGEGLEGHGIYLFERAVAPNTLALVTNNGAIYAKDVGGVTHLFWVDSDDVEHQVSDAASGDVVGPASATDTAIPTYDGTTGKLIQDNDVILYVDGSDIAAIQRDGELRLISQSSHLALESLGGSITLTPSQNVQMRAASGAVFVEDCPLLIKDGGSETAPTLSLGYDVHGDNQTGFGADKADEIITTTGGIGERTLYREATSAAGTAVDIATIPIPDESAVRISVSVVSRDTAATSTDQAAWETFAVARREGGAGAQVETKAVTPVGIGGTTVVSFALVPSGNDIIVRATPDTIAIKCRCTVRYQIVS